VITPQLSSALSAPNPNYNVMGVAKAALEAFGWRYLAAEARPQKQVRRERISAGPIRTLASSASAAFST